MGKKGKKKKKAGGKKKMKQHGAYDNNNWNGWGSGTNSWKTCQRKAVIHVLDVDQARIWAGSGIQCENAVEDQGEEGAPENVALVLNLTGNSRRYARPAFEWYSGAAGALPSLHAASKGSHEVPQFVMNWPDGGTPPITQYGLDLLWDDLNKLEGDILVHCIGGHGRTGTLLAWLAWKTGACGDEDPVQWVRDTYCKEAVETSSQLAWLRDHGVPTKVNTGKRIHAPKKPVKPNSEADLDKWVEDHCSDQSVAVQEAFREIAKWDVATPFNDLVQQAIEKVQGETPSKVKDEGDDDPWFCEWCGQETQELYSNEFTTVGGGVCGTCNDGLNMAEDLCEDCGEVLVGDEVFSCDECRNLNMNMLPAGPGYEPPK